MQLAVVTGLLAGVPLQDVQRDGSEKIVSVLANPDFGVWTVKRNVVAVLTKSRVIEKRESAQSVKLDLSHPVVWIPA